MLSATAIDGKTITGGIFRTDSGAAGHVPRVEITSADVRKISFYSGNTYEAMPGSVGITTNGVDESILEIDSPDYGAGVAMIELRANFAGNKNIYLHADTVRVYANLNVDGKINPQTNYVNGTSPDGIWIQDQYSTAKRWKLSYNSSTGKLQVRFDGATFANFTKD